MTILYHRFEPPPLGHTWQLNIAPAYYQTDHVIDGTRTLTLAAGAALPNNVVTIYPNGRYLWKANGLVLQGVWQRGENKLILKNGYESRDWNAQVEKFDRNEIGHLTLWQGPYEKLTGAPLGTKK